ncbi:MAG: ankyrin repeat domain-containing protein [Candidatus Berkiella sp.]
MLNLYSLFKDDRSIEDISKLKNDPDFIQSLIESIKKMNKNDKNNLLNLKDAHQWNILHWVIHFSDRQVYDVLASQVDLKKLDKAAEGGLTPLLLACQCAEGQETAENIALSLIEKGFSTDVLDEAANSPLHWASISGFKRVVAKLIESGCELNKPNKDNLTPMSLAARNGHIEITKMINNAIKNRPAPSVRRAT